MSRPARRWIRVALATAFTLAALAASARSAHAWGREGHRAAARLTESRLSPAALAAVRGLLEEGESLADASTWADEVRRSYPVSRPWHYVNFPITAPCYDARFCPRRGCVVSKIEDFRKVLADRTAPRAERQEALRFLVHFVQDLHQPLHVGNREDRGGNDTQVQFFGKGSNLHKVWDSGLFDRGHDGEADLLARLETLAAADDAQTWASGTTEDWADESLQAARRAYVQPDVDLPLRSGAKLGAAYQVIHLPVAETRLAQAGVRLAEILNALYAEK